MKVRTRPLLVCNVMIPKVHCMLAKSQWLRVVMYGNPLQDMSMIAYAGYHLMSAEKTLFPARLGMHNDCFGCTCRHVYLVNVVLDQYRLKDHFHLLTTRVGSRVSCLGS